jgi:hypothetical protein
MELYTKEYTRLEGDSKVGVTVIWALRWQPRATRGVYRGIPPVSGVREDSTHWATGSFRRFSLEGQYSSPMLLTAERGPEMVLLDDLGSLNRLRRRTGY